MGVLSTEVAKNVGTETGVLPTPFKAFKHTTVISIIAVVIWLGGIHVNVVVFFLALFMLPSMVAFT
jgi:hypothetical protein